MSTHRNGLVNSPVRMVVIVTGIAGVLPGCAATESPYTRARRLDTPAAYWAFLAEYPSDLEAESAKERLIVLKNEVRIPSSLDASCTRLRPPRCFCQGALCPEWYPIVKEERSMRHTYHAICILIMLVLSSCSTILGTSGRDFPADSIGKIVVGQTTKAQMVRTLGVPQETRRRLLDTVPYDIFEYRFTYVEEGSSRMRVKRLVCEFKDDLLRAYEFSSNITADQVKFDEGVRSRLKPGAATQADTRSLLRALQTRALLPTTFLSSSPPIGSAEMWTYFYKYTRRPGDPENNSTKSLTLYFDATGLLLGSSYLEETEEK